MQTFYQEHKYTAMAAKFPLVILIERLLKV